jgi:hypothetical protein
MSTSLYHQTDTESPKRGITATTCLVEPFRNSAWQPNSL